MGACGGCAGCWPASGGCGGYARWRQAQSARWVPAPAALAGCCGLCGPIRCRCHPTLSPQPLGLSPFVGHCRYGWSHCFGCLHCADCWRCLRHSCTPALGSLGVDCRGAGAAGTGKGKPWAMARPPGAAKGPACPGQRRRWSRHDHGGTGRPCLRREGVMSRAYPTPPPTLGQDKEVPCLGPVGPFGMIATDCEFLLRMGGGIGQLSVTPSNLLFHPAEIVGLSPL